MTSLVGDRVTLAGGETIPAGVVLVAVGAELRVALAADAGLEVDQGMLADAQLRTSAPGMFAAGDVAAVDHPMLGPRIRVKH